MSAANWGAKLGEWTLRRINQRLGPRSAVLQGCSEACEAVMALQKPGTTCWGAELVSIYFEPFDELVGYDGFLRQLLPHLFTIGAFSIGIFILKSLISVGCP